jgi:hormone-sensitive lipase
MTFLHVSLYFLSLYCYFILFSFFHSYIFFALFREIEACNHLLGAITTLFHQLLQFYASSEDGNLFPIEEHTPEEVLQRATAINQFAFYGRCLGFQFFESIKPVLKFIAVSMTSFSESYYSNNGTFIKATNSMFTGGKYFFDPELRSRRIVNISQNASVDFCKVRNDNHKIDNNK